MLEHRWVNAASELAQLRERFGASASSAGWQSVTIPTRRTRSASVGHRVVFGGCAMRGAGTTVAMELPCEEQR